MQTTSLAPRHPENEGLPESGDTHRVSTAGKPKPRVATNHPLPSERSAWPKHFHLLTNAASRSNWGQRPIDSSLIEEGVAAQAATLNVAFFVDVGLLEKKGRQYQPTEACVNFVKMLGLDPERARPILRGLVEKTWFAEAARNALAARGTMTPDELAKELAINAAVSSYDSKKASFAILVTYLAWTGVVVPDGESLRLGAGAPATATPVAAPAIPPFAPPEAASQPATLRPAVRTDPAPGEWVHAAWPGEFDLRVRPHPAAIARAESFLANLRTMADATAKLQPKVAIADDL